MALDLTKAAAQISGMVSSLKADGQSLQQRLQSALETASSETIDLDKLDRKINDSRPTWLVAGLVEGFARHYPVPPLPVEFSVLATDGSHIDVDRNQPARCYLINIGSVILRYGASPDAILTSFPHLYVGDKDMVIAPVEGNHRPQAVEGVLLGIKRAVDECQRLAEMAAGLPPGSSALALLDGSLVLWGLEAYPEFVTEILLNNGLLKHLEQIRNSGRDKKLALASYISFPRSTDVVNALRVALCPRKVIDSDRDCPDCQTRECDAVAGVQDRELFAELLGQGERSTLFISRSSVVQKRYGEHLVYFFYLRVDDEIARVEIPQWSATDKERLDLAHSLILDQCRRGQGYPVALSEAHEQAVVTTADRENFWKLVESLLVEEHLPTTTSAKSRSKRTRWV